MSQDVSPSNFAILRSFGLITLAFVLAVFSLPPQAKEQATPGKWQPGDLAVGTAPGQWKIHRPSLGAVIDNVTDTNGSPGVSSPGTPSSSALDNSWHLLGVDAGANKIARFRISPHDANNPSDAFLSPVPIEQPKNWNQERTDMFTNPESSRPEIAVSPTNSRLSACVVVLVSSDP